MAEAVFWNAERSAEAIRLRHEGWSASQIARAVGAVSRSAVIGFFHRKGLTRGAAYEPGTRPDLPRWASMSKDEKLAIIKEGIAAGRTTVEIARKHGAAAARTVGSYANKHGFRFLPVHLAKERRRLGSSSLVAKVALLRKRAPAPPTAPIPEPIVPVVSRRLSLMALQANECRWIDGDPKGEHGYCGHPMQAGSSYCKWHHRVCYHAVSDRRADLVAKHAEAA